MRPPPPQSIVGRPPHINKKFVAEDHPTVAIPTLLLTLFCIVGLFVSNYMTLFGPHSLVMIPEFQSNVSQPRILQYVIEHNSHVKSFFEQTSLQLTEDALFSWQFWFHFVIRSALMFALFTPMHDACHHSIAKRQFIWLNDVVGHLCSFFFGAPFRSFSRIHLEHHKYTNSLYYDPDIHSSGGTRGYEETYGIWKYIALPLNCMTQLYYYIIHVALYYLKDRPFATLLDLCVVVVAMIIPLCSFFTTHYNYLFYGWHLNVLAAVMYLGLCFDFLPHRPKDSSTNPLLATSLITLWKPKRKNNNTSGSGSDNNYTPEEISNSGISYLTPFLLGQNFHAVHHAIDSTIPWYRYSQVFWRNAEEMCINGLRAYPLFPIFVEKEHDNKQKQK